MMKKIYKESQLLEVNNIPVEVIESIKVTIDILNENYGENRDIEADLGGYVVIAESWRSKYWNKVSYKD